MQPMSFGEIPAFDLSESIAPLTWLVVVSGYCIVTVIVLCLVRSVIRAERDSLRRESQHWKGLYLRWIRVNGLLLYILYLSVQIFVEIEFIKTLLFKYATIEKSKFFIINFIVRVNKTFHRYIVYA